MFQNILRSLSGSFADLTRWEPTADRSEVGLRSNIEKSILFLLCSSAIMGISALLLGVSQQPVYCDRGLAFWNGLLGAILLTTAAACSAALFFDTHAVQLMAKLIWNNCESSFFEFGSTALHISACVAGCPVVALLWIMRGYVDVTSSPTCRNTAALLYGGTITNLTLTVSAIAFTMMMVSYSVASSKRFYDIAILACICDPITVAVQAVGESLPPPPPVHLPHFVPSLDECVAKLPTYEKTRALVKRIVTTIYPSSLPMMITNLMERRLY